MYRSPSELNCTKSSSTTGMARNDYSSGSLCHGDEKSATGNSQEEALLNVLGRAVEISKGSPVTAFESTDTSSWDRIVPSTSSATLPPCCRGIDEPSEFTSVANSGFSDDNRSVSTFDSYSTHNEGKSSDQSGNIPSYSLGGNLRPNTPGPLISPDVRIPSKIENTDFDQALKKLSVSMQRSERSRSFFEQLKMGKATSFPKANTQSKRPNLTLMKSFRSLRHFNMSADKEIKPHSFGRRNSLDSNRAVRRNSIEAKHRTSSRRDLVLRHQSGRLPRKNSLLQGNEEYDRKEDINISDDFFDQSCDDLTEPSFNNTPARESTRSSPDTSTRLENSNEFDMFHASGFETDITDDFFEKHFK